MGGLDENIIGGSGSEKIIRDPQHCESMINTKPLAQDDGDGEVDNMSYS